jgi:hypothetical protein
MAHGVEGVLAEVSRFSAETVPFNWPLSSLALMVVR